jgi:hypothetical protein
MNFQNFLQGLLNARQLLTFNLQSSQTQQNPTTSLFLPKPLPCNGKSAIEAEEKCARIAAAAACA